LVEAKAQRRVARLRAPELGDQAIDIAALRARL